MLPSLLITFREVIEAALIVATILGILTKLDQKKEIKTVWLATVGATIVSIGLLTGASLAGIKVQQVYTGKTEELIDGLLMITSAIFITWAVFFLHNYFGRYKTKLLAHLKETVETGQQRGLFFLVFTAVVREGFEIVLFLSTIYLSSNPQQVLGGFALGGLLALLVCLGLFAATVKMPVFYAFRITSILLILFAAGLLARGAHEFVESGILAATPNVYLPFLPEKTTIAGSMIKSIFGLTQQMDVVQLTLYTLYTGSMTWWVFLKSVPTSARDLSDCYSTPTPAIPNREFRVDHEHKY